MNDPKLFAQLSLSERQLAFEHWVAYNSKTISNAISTKGGFVCPLLPCLERFKDLESCLQHLLVCPKLSQASYWCPFCQKEENFATLGPCRDGILKSPVSRKPSGLKRAIVFVKCFGRKSSISTRNDQRLVLAKSRHPLPPAPSYYCQPQQSELSVKRQTRPPELSYNCQPQQPELSVKRQTQPRELSDIQIFELSALHQSELPNTPRIREQSSVEPSANDAPQVGQNQYDIKEVRL